jgi:hypothetical protein
MARPFSTIEVYAPREVALEALLDVPGAEELPVGPGRPYHVVRLGTVQAIALWLKDQQLMVITVHEDDSALPVAAALFARLAARTRNFQIRHDAPGEVRYEFAIAS